MNNEKTKTNTAFYIRLGIGITLFVLAVINAITGIGITKEEADCIKDKSHIALTGLNLYFQEHIIFKNILIIINSFIIDISIIFTSYFWIMYCKSWRIVIHFILFISLKLICQHLFIMKFPEDSLWSNPGFPSVFVSYNEKYHLFFSGGIGSCLICADYLFNSKIKLYRIISIIIFITIPIQMIFGLAIRSIYLIDILSSIAGAVYMGIISYYISPWFDKKHSLVEDTNIDIDNTYNANSNKIEEIK
jgi:hypothetical protein